MNVQSLSGKRILLLGYGIEGKATHKFLSRFVPSAKVSWADKSSDPAYLEKQEGYDLIIRSPGVPKALVRGEYTTATNIFFELVRGVTIGVTGSKGKSTTASLIAAIAQAAGKKVFLIGNIGFPMLEALGQSNSPDDVFVCELSSYQLDDIRHSPHISVVTNLFSEHMDYHGSIPAYIEAKMNIIKYAKNRDYFVYNPRVAKLQEIAGHTIAQAVGYVETLPFSQDSIGLIGEHNKDNVRAACTVAGILGIPADVQAQAVRDFRPLPHRLERIGTFRGITFYDDAISTTPESTVYALEALPRTKTILLGGLDRGYDFTPLARAIGKSNITGMVLFPDSHAAIEKALAKEGVAVPHILRTKDMRQAVAFCYEHTPKGSVCLLSTASPSYSVWKNFEEKGDLFRAFVRKLGSA